MLSRLVLRAIVLRQLSYHILEQYPSEQHEQQAYYSGYDGRVHRSITGEEAGDSLESYTGYSIWVRIVSFAPLEFLLINHT
jgi:hypothetical protein